MDFYYGREFNPSMGGFDVKLVAFRASMIALALVNVLLVLDSVNASRGVVNGAVMATAAFQVSVYVNPSSFVFSSLLLGLSPMPRLCISFFFLLVHYLL